MFRFLNLANTLTMVSLVAALTSVAWALHGALGYAMIAMITAGVCDILDGMVARRTTRTPQEHQFGSALDSLVDVCAFGVAPAVLFYAVGMRSIAESILWVAFPLAVVWRVAYFHVVGLEESLDSRRRTYTGLPCTYAALILPAATLCGLYDGRLLRWSVGIAAAATAVLMVSTIAVPRPNRIAYATFLILAAIAIPVFFIYNTKLSPLPFPSTATMTP